MQVSGICAGTGKVQNCRCAEGRGADAGAEVQVASAGAQVVDAVQVQVVQGQVQRRCR